MYDICLLLFLFFSWNEIKLLTCFSSISLMFCCSGSKSFRSLRPNDNNAECRKLRDFHFSFVSARNCKHQKGVAWRASDRNWASGQRKVLINSFYESHLFHFECIQYELKLILFLYLLERFLAFNRHPL